MIDCLIIGFNDINFEGYVNMLKGMGSDSGAFKDVSLTYVDYEGRPRHSMDLLNHFRSEVDPSHRMLHNADFLWPVITYLGTYLNRRGFTFDYVNSFVHDRDKLREKLIKNDIFTIVITTTLYVIPQPILEIVSFIRKYNKTAKIIIGGPFIQNQTTAKMYDDRSVQVLFKSIGADIYVVSQEGELALSHVLRALKGEVSFDDIPNIAYRKGKDFVRTMTTAERNPLEENLPDYSLFSPANFGEFVSLRTAKSCPFSCSFCGFPQRAGKYAFNDVELVEQELNAIRDLGGVTTLTFIDDTFNIPKPKFKEVLRMMIKNNYGFKWNCFYRSDHGDEEAIELMREAGCEGVFLGCESGSDKVLERMNKTARRKDYATAIPLLRKAGIVSYASLIIGFPGETEETVNETIAFLNESRPDFFRAQLWYCDPMTPIWNKRDEYGIKGAGFAWSHNTMDSKTACDVIDRIFLNVDSSVWLPQNGFELWSVFYLQRKGMSLEQVKTYLRAFNGGVREKIRGRALSPETVEQLRSAALAGHSATLATR